MDAKPAQVPKPRVWRFNGKKLRSELAYTAFCLVACVCIVGCSTLFEPDRQSASPYASPALHPNPKIVDAVKETGRAFGPWGEILAGLAVLGLNAAAVVASRRHTNKTFAAYRQTSAERSIDQLPR